MFDIHKHKYYLVRILKDIYSDTMLSTVLGFKGGTAHVLFYNLPRFSVDLDFNLLDETEFEVVFEKVYTIVSKYGKIKDEATKHFGLLLVLNYGTDNRNLKLEISKRKYNDRYQNLNYLGISVKVMHMEDMFAHKLCALTDSKSVASRDVFDIYYFLKDNVQINQEIVKKRTNMELSEYIDCCIKTIQELKKTSMLQGIGELVDDESKNFVKNKLKDETINFLKIYKGIYL
jgi:predicted nucleotidyltransferase component of viral defense system